MDEKTTETMPTVSRGERWKPRRQQKRTFVEPQPDAEHEKEEEPRKPAPLPFGHIDLLA